MSFSVSDSIEDYRIYLPIYDDIGDKQNGVFVIKHMGLQIVASSGGGWEHVSVSRRSRMPTYEDMCWTKDQFWSADQTVMQLHVPREDHVNCHEYCLHLWRPIDQEIPRPPAIFVGPTSK